MGPADKIKDLVSKGETKEAIQLLLKYSKSQNKNFQQQALSLSAQYEQWKRDKTMGVNEGNIELRKVEAGVLDLAEDLGSIETGNTKDNSKVEGKKDRGGSFPVIVRIAPILLLGILAAFWFSRGIYTKDPLETLESAYDILIPIEGDTIVKNELIKGYEYCFEIRGRTLKANEEKVYWAIFHLSDWFPQEEAIPSSQNSQWKLNFCHGIPNDKPRPIEPFILGLSTDPSFSSSRTIFKKVNFTVKLLEQ